MHLNHPETIPPPSQSMEKVSVFHKMGPWCHKGHGPLQEGNTDVHSMSPSADQCSQLLHQGRQSLSDSGSDPDAARRHRRDPGHTASLPELASTLSGWRRCKHLAEVPQGCQDPKLHLQAA